MDNLIGLSASRINTFNTCSYLYYQKYVLFLPDRPHPSATMGNIVHLVFEVLLNPRHRKHFNAIISADNVEGSPATLRLVNKHLVKNNLYDLENCDLMNKMILVGLNHDFFGEGGQIIEPEFKFKLQNKDPKYKITGFMDKPIKYETDKSILVVDYKTKRAKYAGEELEFNIQAIMYSLASKKLFPDYKPRIQFLFLKFPNKPKQELEFTDDQLLGFEYMLEEYFIKVNSFKEKDAFSNFAFDNPNNKWLCGRGSFKCAFKDPFVYFKLMEGTKIIKTAFKESDLAAKEGQRIEKAEYAGCPKWQEDDFGF